MYHRLIAADRSPEIRRHSLKFTKTRNVDCINLLLCLLCYVTWNQEDWRRDAGHWSVFRPATSSAQEYRCNTNVIPMYPGTGQLPPGNPLWTVAQKLDSRSQAPWNWPGESDESHESEETGHKINKWTAVWTAVWTALQTCSDLFWPVLQTSLKFLISSDFVSGI